MEERFGEPPDLTTMIFTVGLQECGQGSRTFKKDEKLEVMHVGVCTLLAQWDFTRNWARTRTDGRISKEQEKFLPCPTGRARIADETRAVGVFRRVDR